MDVLGFEFFQGFMHYLGVLQWPLVVVFLLFIAWQIRGFAPEERLQTGLMFSYFFLVITTFWILKPIKKGLFISYYKEVGGFDLLGWWQFDAAQAELLAKVLNMAVAAAAVAVFTLLARSFRRQQLTFILSGFFILCYLAYSFLLDNAGGGTVWTFYLFGDLFSTLMVATFFAFLNDSVDPGSAKRLYGLIGLGGVSGGFFGSAVVGVNVKSLSPALSMWLCLAIAVAIALVALAAGRVVSRKLAAQETGGSKAEDASDSQAAQTEDQPQGNPAWEGARLALRSRYLLSVVAIVGLYEMVSTIMDFQFTSTVLHYLDGPQIGEHFPRVFTFTNMVALVVQLFLTSFVMTRFGVGPALLFLPVAALLGSAGFLIAPVLLLGSLLNTTDNGFSYSINQSAKEALYVPTTRDEKYKAKAFIDMFVQRFAKALAVGLSLLITTLFAGYSSIRWLSLVTAAILLLWILAARYAGRSFREKEEGAAASV